MVDEDCKTNLFTLPFQDTGYFSKIICDYLDNKETLRPFYHNRPDLEGLHAQLLEKKASFSSKTRVVLVEALRRQYQNLTLSTESKNHLDQLSEENTFTITTGHQLNLFTGPLYFLYKIISAIKLSEALKKANPKYNFVPVYWMATEDHDFDEINYFNFKQNKLRWNRESGGAVGRMDTKSLDEVLAQFDALLPSTTNATKLKELFEQAYLNLNTLTEATRYLANALFANYGLIIVDGDDPSLKKLWSPFVKDELLEQTSNEKVLETIATLEKSYPIQVNPREINLFYLVDGLRERIILNGDRYEVNNSNISLSREEILKELQNYPERFSPNALLRPFYQEVILPNLCYIGGGGELAYWFELKSYFESMSIPFPVLLLRNSVLIQTAKQSEKLKKLNIQIDELFMKQHELINKKIREHSKLKIDFSEQRALLEKQFASLEDIAKQTDASFIGAVKAQTKKQLKGLDHLEKRLLKAEKRKHVELTRRIKNIQDDLFPNQSLEERQRNFSELYLEYGDALISVLKKELDPLSGEFTVLTI